ncbi:MAG: hypothetical protein QXL21_04645, partial [Nitrososphaerales archaeon]
MNDNTLYPLRRNKNLLPQTFSFTVTNILSKGQVYDVTGAWMKRRTQLGLVQVTRGVEQLQKVCGSKSAEELFLEREYSIQKEVEQVERVWSSLADACVNLREKGLDTTSFISTLGLIKPLINLYKTHIKIDRCSTLETGAKIRNDLRSVEDRLLAEIANKMGVEEAT